MSPAGQLPLALAPPRRPGFDNFVSGPNAAVVRTLKEGLADGQWYFLGGAAGSGRTHLALAVYAGLLGRGCAARFLPLGNGQARNLLQTTSGDWIVLDDVDALAGNQEGERALFNALNQWRADRSGVLMTGAGRASFHLPDLKSRLGQATRLNLRPLDEAHLRELIRMLAAEHHVALGRGVEDYLVRRAARSSGAVASFMEASAGKALAEQRVLSIPLVRELLSEP